VPRSPSLLRFAPPRHEPRGVLLGRHTTRYPSLVGLAMHAPERRQPQRNLSSTTLAGLLAQRVEQASRGGQLPTSALSVFSYQLVGILRSAGSSAGRLIGAVPCGVSKNVARNTATVVPEL
jgi:hypothetical protein